jgi:hypothetical protein
VTGKRKLLEKQKEGKKRMRQFGKVEIQQSGSSPPSKWAMPDRGLDRGRRPERDKDHQAEPINAAKAQHKRTVTMIGSHRNG